MRLRNKKTGEIGELTSVLRTFVYVGDTPKYEYETLSDLNKEWEDYEKPDKKQFIVSDDGEICPYMVDYINEGTDRGRSSIGNYFETKEEAEQAVEKLKAWKRLKEAGFVFEGYDGRNIKYNVYRKNSEDIMPDLDLLFSEVKNVDLH